jgi:chromosome segregation ATPase
MEKKETGLAEVRRVCYELYAQWKTSTVRDAFELVGGNYNEVAALVREVNRERSAAQTIIGGLPEAVQNAILALLSGLVEGKGEIIRNLYRSEQKMLEDALEQLRNVECLYNALKSELARLQSDHTHSEHDLLVKLATKTEVNATLDRRCGELERDKENLVRENEAARSEAAQARAELGRIEPFLKASEMQLKEKEARLADTLLQLAEAQQRAAAGEARVSEMQLRIADHEKMVRKLDDTLAALDATRTELYEARSIAAVAEARRDENEKRNAQPEALMPKSAEDKQSDPPNRKTSPKKEIVSP